MSLSENKNTELEQYEEFCIDSNRRNLYADGLIKGESAVGIDVRTQTILDIRNKAKKFLNELKRKN